MYSNILKDIGIEKENTPWGWLPDDQRQKKWKQEREDHGFDEREMWNLDITLLEFIYPRLKYFKDYGINFVDEPFEYQNETMTLKEAIDKILYGIELYLKNDYIEVPKESDYALHLLAYILPMLWN